MESNIKENLQLEEMAILKFKVGGNSYGFDLKHINEILPCSEVTQVPNADSNIEGIIILRDTVLTVVNLAKFMDVNLIKSRSERIIIVDYQKEYIALHVDRVSGIYNTTLSEEIDVEKDKPTNSENINELNRYKNITQGYVKVDNKQFPVLDLEKIIKQINPTL